MEGALYLKRLDTPAGNVGHELVMVVSREAVAKARHDAEDARRRALEAKDDAERVRLRREADAARIARRDAVLRMAEAWMADKAKGVRNG